MKRDRKRYPYLKPWPLPGTILMIQPPLPTFLHTPAILLTIQGQGSGRQGPSPLAPPEEPANEQT